MRVFQIPCTLIWKYTSTETEHQILFPLQYKYYRCFLMLFNSNGTLTFEIKINEIWCFLSVLHILEL